MSTSDTSGGARMSQQNQLPLRTAKMLEKWRKRTRQSEQVAKKHRKVATSSGNDKKTKNRKKKHARVGAWQKKQKQSNEQWERTKMVKKETRNSMW